jgi:hypothetical protein
VLDNRWEFLEDEYEEAERFVPILRTREKDEGRLEPPHMKEYQSEDAPLPTKHDDPRGT